MQQEIDCPLRGSKKEELRILELAFLILHLAALEHERAVDELAADEHLFVDAYDLILEGFVMNDLDHIAPVFPLEQRADQSSPSRAMDK